MPRRRRPAATPRARLEQAAEGLLYASEDDRPFEFVAIPSADRRDAPLDPATFARLIGTPAAPAEAVTLDDFLARHRGRSDSSDPEARRLRPRWERLAATLRDTLDDVRVYRVGAEEGEVGCYVVGWMEDGTLAGLRTVALET